MILSWCCFQCLGIPLERASGIPFFIFRALALGARASRPPFGSWPAGGPHPARNGRSVPQSHFADGTRSTLLISTTQSSLLPLDPSLPERLGR